MAVGTLLFRGENYSAVIFDAILAAPPTSVCRDASTSVTFENKTRKGGFVQGAVY